MSAMTVTIGVAFILLVAGAIFTLLSFRTQGRGPNRRRRLGDIIRSRWS